MIGRGCGGGKSRGQKAEVLTQQPAGKLETTLSVATEKAMVMATKNAASSPSRDLVTAALVLAAEALAALKAATSAALVLVAEDVALVIAAEAAATLKADDANGGDGSTAIVGGASLAMGGRVIH